MAIPIETLKEILAGMTEQIRDLYMGTSEITVVEMCDELGTKYNLEKSQVNSLIDIIGDILLGVKKFETLSFDVGEATKSRPGVAMQIVEELNQKIFNPIREDVEKRYTAFEKYREAPAPEVPQAPSAPKPFVDTAQWLAQDSTPQAQPPTPEPASSIAPEKPLDREALLRELESPAPFNVPFTPQKTTFEEKVAPQTPRDFYREEPKP